MFSHKHWWCSTDIKRSNILVGWSMHTAHDNIKNFDVCETFRAQCLQCLRQTVGRASKVWGVLSPTPCHYFIPTTPVTCSTSSLMVIDEACELWHAHWPRVIILYLQVLLTWPKWPTVVIQRDSVDGALFKSVHTGSTKNSCPQHRWPVPPGPWHASRGLWHAHTQNSL